MDDVAAACCCYHNNDGTPPRRYLYAATDVTRDMEKSYHNNNTNPNHQGRECTIEVHSHIVILGYVSCLLSFVFCIAVVLLPPGPTLANGALRYISEGLELFCGWGAVVMGTCSMLILLCQLVASAYMRDQRAALWALLQAVSWNTVAGVSGTGWTAHYVALIFFLAGNLAFNYAASNDAAYGSRAYRAANASAVVFSLVFLGVGMGSMVCGMDSTAGATLRSFAVAFEFVVMFCFVLQTLCLVHALDTYHTIHLRFEQRRS